ncbi:DNA-binding response regulator, partial [Salmonella enterica subsp. enterica serovar Infantis]|nr:DNA-binding response regulator [Salmonella enterica subsp. enterica serovar Infantis]EGI5078423.1 DNA-binding response regulator [Salmonella enterica subsp. enterica serovar Infantis]EGI5078553.1 DNA-binding response regulator [Salmonella enterica subsp. enterica serovar Infantis]
MEPCIWLIDDDAAIRDSLSLLLSTVGWQTHA